MVDVLVHGADVVGVVADEVGIDPRLAEAAVERLLGVRVAVLLRMGLRRIPVALEAPRRPDAAHGRHVQHRAGVRDDVAPGRPSPAADSSRSRRRAGRRGTGRAAIPRGRGAAGTRRNACRTGTACGTGRRRRPSPSSPAPTNGRSRGREGNAPPRRNGAVPPAGEPSPRTSRCRSAGRRAAPSPSTAIPAARAAFPAFPDGEWPPSPDVATACGRPSLPTAVRGRGRPRRDGGRGRLVAQDHLTGRATVMSPFGSIADLR